MIRLFYNPFAPAVHADPYPVYRRLRAEDPVHWSELLDCWVISRYDDAVFVLTDNRFSADRRRTRNRFAEMMEQRQAEFGVFGRAHTMLNTDPPEHTRLRRLVSKAFTARAVENMRPHIQSIVDSLLSEAEGQDGMDVVRDLANPLPVIVIAEMLGVPPEDRDRFRRWSSDVAATLSGPFAVEEVVQRGRRSVEELTGYLAGVIAQRRRAPRQDLISALIAAEEQGNVLSNDELLATLILLLIAGNETTTHLLGNGLLALLQNPDQMERLVADPSLLPNAVEEILRYATPVQGTSRVALEEIDLGGKRISEGQLVYALLASANRDGAIFEDPERLDITREKNPHLAFGDGRHFCLGAPLARAEVQTAIGSLLSRFPGLRMEAIELERPEWGGTFVIRGLKRLPVKW